MLLLELARVNNKTECCASVDERQWESVALVIDVQDGMCTCWVSSFNSLGTIEDHVWIRISTA